MQSETSSASISRTAARDATSARENAAGKKSCESCKSRKVKCDRQQPSCSWCLRNNRRCVYTERRKPGYASSELGIDDKIIALESSLHSLTQRMDHFIPDNSQFREMPDPLGGKQVDGSVSIGNTSPFTQTYQQVDTHYSDSDFDQHKLSPANTSVDQMTFNVETYGDTAIELVNSSLSRHELPPYRLMTKLIDLFFKHIIIWAPILIRDTVESILSPANIPEESHVLLHAIVATTLRFSEEPNLTVDASLRQRETSRQKVLAYAMNNLSIVSLQALAVITLDTLGTSEGQEGQILLALLRRSITSMGLESEKQVYLSSSAGSRPSTDFRSTWAIHLDCPENWTDEEGRRRLVWLLYMLDRYAAVMTNSEFELSESCMNLALPCQYDSFSKNELAETKWFSQNLSWDSSTSITRLGSFSFHCELLIIISQIHRFIRAPLDMNSAIAVQDWRIKYRMLDAKLNEWLSSLPEHAEISKLCHPDPAARVSNWIMIQAAFILAVIRLHSTAGYPETWTQQFAPSNNAMQRCLAAVESLHRITLDVIQANALHYLGYPYANVLWIAASLLLVHAATMHSDVDRTIWFFINSLDSLSKFWPIAGFYAVSLRRAIHYGNQAESDSALNMSGGSETNFALLRRQASELIRQINCRRTSVHMQMTSQSVSSNELTIMEVFSFFNFPNLDSTVTPAAPEKMTDEVRTSYEDDVTADEWRSGYQVSTLAEKRHHDTFPSNSSAADWLDYRSSYELRIDYL